MNPFDSDRSPHPDGSPDGSDPPPHSAVYLDDARDDWWNPDFLALMAARWHLAATHSLLDVGCGLGHWSALLLPHLGPDAAITGVDREDAWVIGAAARFRRLFPNLHPDRARFLRAEAEGLPFPAGVFDVVTCQTLLIHLPRPELALAEMVRVTRPGGLVACVEPSNLAAYAMGDALTPAAPAEVLVRGFAVALREERGKALRGLGDNSLGDRLPGLFAAAGLVDVQVYLSDKASPMVPPYAEPEQQALLAQEEAWATSGSGPWDAEEARTNALAGGATEAEVVAAWREAEEARAERLEAIRRGEYHAAGGAVLYLVSGRTPTSPGSTGAKPGGVRRR